jgi:uncharacterized protein YegP (UPF0339 family)
MIKVQFYRSKKNRQWYWRAVARNGRKVAVGGEGYKTKVACIKGFQVIVKAVMKGRMVIDIRG